MRTSKRVLAGALLAVAAGAAGSSLSACGGSGGGPVGSVRSVGRVGPVEPLSAAGAPRVARVAGAGRPDVADAAGRWLFLRGVAVTGLVQYAQDYAENPPLMPSDLAEIAALGFDYVRLAISWSRLEPQPGRFDARYLAAVARAVAWARAAHLDVVVDFHVDRYNRLLAPGDEADGAPDWATLTGGASPGGCVTRIGSARCVQAAWQAFWTDAHVAGEGLQERYIGALRAVSRRLRPDANVLGLELMNNPSTGFTPSPGFERLQLWPFWRRAVASLRADGERRPLWLDGNASSETLGVNPGPAARFSGDGQLVYAPHDYAGVFSGPGWPAGGVTQLVSWFASAAEFARAFGMAGEIGEWGTGTGPGSDRWIQDQLNLQDRFVVGSAFWVWKQRPGFYNWPVVRVDGSLRRDSLRAQELSEPHPDAVPGVVDAVSYRPGGPLVVRLHGPGGVAVLWSGTRVVRGGPSLLARPLAAVRIDGRAVRAELRPLGFSGPGVRLAGDLVSVRVPPGVHTLTLGR
jgi:hypothetical protein